MPNALKGMLAGLVATLVLSGLMILNSTLELLPQVSIIRLLTALGTLTVPSAWMDHVIVGVVVWPLLFVGFDSLASRPAPWLKGMMFGVFAWLVMMVAFMPLAGAGFFGAKIDSTTPVALLIVHLVYGIVLGATYGLLGSLAPVRIPVKEGAALATPAGFTIDTDNINDNLPTSSPSGRTVLAIFGCLLGFFVLLALTLEFRTTLGF